MKVAILGYGDQGRSAYEHWAASGHEITICDINPKLKAPKNAKKRLGPDHLKNLDEFDILVRTPGLHPREIVAANPANPRILDKVTTVTNEFFRVSPSKHIIGVTGTKGKGTTSTLIAKMLEAAGYRVHLGGNIGKPPLDLLKNEVHANDWVVLELANFQLIDLKYSPPIAVCLMVAPEHMDWHTDFAEYLRAKQQLFIHQSGNSTAIYYAQNENSKAVASVSPGNLIPYYAPPGAIVDSGAVSIGGQEIYQTGELKLLGKHNWQNVCAAVTAVWPIIQDIKPIKKVLSTFSGLEHRLEFVRELDGVKYYDDSFGTTPETAIVAIEAFSEPKVVILGGSDKGAHYRQLARAVKNNNVRTVVNIGQTGPAIGQALKTVGYSNVHEGGKTMTEIVSKAHQLAKPGDIVLLSTACASFGLFKNYKERGEQFKKAVMSLS